MGWPLKIISAVVLRRTLFAALVSSLVACGITLSAIDSRESDSVGKLQDRGWRFPWGRYFMNLGTIDLSQIQERRFEVKGLPAERQFVLGFQIDVGDCKIQNSELQVSLKMTEEHGLVVINEDHAFRQLLWSKGRSDCAPTFGYVRGQGRETPLDRVGNVCNQPIITGADGGYGTRFVSRQEGVYTVTIKVHGTAIEELNAVSARIVIEDNGPNKEKVCP